MMYRIFSFLLVIVIALSTTLVSAARVRYNSGIGTTYTVSTPQYADYYPSASAYVYEYNPTRPSETIYSEYLPENSTVTAPAAQNYPNINTSSVVQYYNPTYVYTTALPVISTGSRYPGCTRNDILIGGQMWASCNALTRGQGSETTSGWFFPGEMYASYASLNGIGTRMTWQGRRTGSISWTVGPCASGYRLPTRYEWETAISYARANNTTLAHLLLLAYNGSYYGYRSANGNTTVDARVNVGGGYWSSTAANSTPVVLHLGSDYLGYRTDGTDIISNGSEYRWQYNAQLGYELVAGSVSELANVRCIKN